VAILSGISNRLVQRYVRTDTSSMRSGYRTVVSLPTYSMTTNQDEMDVMTLDKIAIIAGDAISSNTVNDFGLYNLKKNERRK